MHYINILFWFLLTTSVVMPNIDAGPIPSNSFSNMDNESFTTTDQSSKMENMTMAGSSSRHQLIDDELKYQLNSDGSVGIELFNNNSSTKQKQIKSNESVAEVPFKENITLGYGQSNSNSAKDEELLVISLENSFQKYNESKADVDSKKYNLADDLVIDSDSVKNVKVKTVTSTYATKPKGTSHSLEHLLTGNGSNGSVEIEPFNNNPSPKYKQIRSNESVTELSLRENNTIGYGQTNSNSAKGEELISIILRKSYQKLNESKPDAYSKADNIADGLVNDSDSAKNEAVKTVTNTYSTNMKGTSSSLKDLLTENGSDARVDIKLFNNNSSPKKKQINSNESVAEVPFKENTTLEYEQSTSNSAKGEEMLFISLEKAFQIFNKSKADVDSKKYNLADDLVIDTDSVKNEQVKPVSSTYATKMKGTSSSLEDILTENGNDGRVEIDLFNNNSAPKKNQIKSIKSAAELSSKGNNTIGYGQTNSNSAKGEELLFVSLEKAYQEVNKPKVEVDSKKYDIADDLLMDSDSFKNKAIKMVTSTFATKTKPTSHSLKDDADLLTENIFADIEDEDFMFKNSATEMSKDSLAEKLHDIIVSEAEKGSKAPEYVLPPEIFAFGDILLKADEDTFSESKVPMKRDVSCGCTRKHADGKMSEEN